MNLHHHLFHSNNPKVISVVGGGGKTSTLRTLGNEYLDNGKRVIITTTTKMKYPDRPDLLSGNIQGIHDLLDLGRLAVAGKGFNHHKIGAVDASVFKAMLPLADVVINEADGAKMMPLKAPIATEPVYPIQTEAVVVVAGLDCIGFPLKQKCFRIETVMRILKTNDENHLISEQDVAEILRAGYLNQNVFPTSVLLNKADTSEQIKSGEKIASFLPDYNCVITALNGVKPLF